MLKPAEKQKFVNILSLLQESKTKYLKERHEIIHKKIHQKASVGVMNGLWANALGMGGIIPIECFYLPSNNFLDFKLTGLQGDFMKESMNVAKTLAWKLTSKTKKTNWLKSLRKPNYKEYIFIVQKVLFQKMDHPLEQQLLLLFIVY